MGRRVARPGVRPGLLNVGRKPFLTPRSFVAICHVANAVCGRGRNHVLCLTIKKAPQCRAFPVRPRGLEPPRTIKSTRPSTLDGPRGCFCRPPNRPNGEVPWTQWTHGRGGCCHACCHGISPSTFPGADGSGARASRRRVGSHATSPPTPGTQIASNAANERTATETRIGPPVWSRSCGPSDTPASSRTPANPLTRIRTRSAGTAARHRVRAGSPTDARPRSAVTNARRLVPSVLTEGSAVRQLGTTPADSLSTTRSSEDRGRSSRMSHQTRVPPVPSRATPQASDSSLTKKRPIPPILSGSCGTILGSSRDPGSMTLIRSRSSTTTTPTVSVRHALTLACSTLFVTSSLTTSATSDAVVCGVSLVS